MKKEVKTKTKAEKEKKSTRKKIMAWKDAGLFLSSLCGFLVYMTMPVKANALQSTKLVTGLIKLIKDATTVALAIEAVLVILLIIVELMKRQAAPDEEKAKHEKNAKNTLIVGIIIVAITALVPVVLSYFQ